MSGEPADRVRNLLLRGDNQLKHGKPERAVEAFEEALTIATEPRVRELVERRLASARELAE
jgi:predicted negative regulator of RcsB-dependent stress response